jgi:DNA invertase Pin-like site-specific DNA recombinase
LTTPHNRGLRISAFCEELQKAESERNVIRKRTLPGLKAARARGRVGGRSENLSVRDNHRSDHFEHEAHRWAFLRMRDAGIELPQATLRSMLAALICLAREDRDKGEIIDPEIKRIADLPPAEALKE